MADTAIDPLAWLDELPADYAVQVVHPPATRATRTGQPMPGWWWGWMPTGSAATCVTPTP